MVQIHPQHRVISPSLLYCVYLLIPHHAPYYQLAGNWWKGKADIINHNEKLIVDLKTTQDLDKFQWSAKKYNYDSQAFVYKNLFGYDMIFIAIDKSTGQIGIFDCSDDFLSSGFNKVEKASEIYDLFYKTEGFDPQNYFINKTL